MLIYYCRPSFISSVFCSFIHALISLFIYFLSIDKFIIISHHSAIQIFILYFPLRYSQINSFFFVRLFTHSFVHSFVHSFILSFIHSFIHSFFSFILNFPQFSVWFFSYFLFTYSFILLLFLSSDHFCYLSNH